MHSKRKFKFRNNNYIAGHILVVLLASILPLLLGFPVIIWQSDKALHNEARETSIAIVDRINVILDYANDAVTKVTALTDKSCPQMLESLRIRTTTTPFVRSLLIAKQGHVFCSTIFGTIQVPLEVSSFNEGKLALLSGNLVTPGKSVLFYQLKENELSIIASINGQHITQLLNGANTALNSTFIVGSYWMNNQGKVFDKNAKLNENIFSYVSSTKYPFSINSTYEGNILKSYILDHYVPLLVLLICLGALASFIVNRFAHNTRTLTTETRRAIRHNEFTPYYQAVVKSDTTIWVGAEVLVRWNHPREGLIPPDNFIPFMERSGLIIPMTWHLMQRVARELSSLGDQLPDNFHIGINISSKHLIDPDLLKMCKQFLAQFPPRKIRLVLEITEREAIETNQNIQEIFSALRTIGVFIALDDFGVGYSNLIYLQKFKADSLKIDRSFIVGITNNALSQHVLQSMIDLCDRLQLTIVAEGVETQEQTDYLEKKGITFQQGYLFSKPEPLEIFARLLQNNRREHVNLSNVHKKNTATNVNS